MLLRTLQLMCFSAPRLIRLSLQTFIFLFSVTLCNPNPCANGGKCSVLEDRYNCACSKQYTGKHCEGTVCRVCDLIYCVSSSWVSEFTKQNIGRGSDELAGLTSLSKKWEDTKDLPFNDVIVKAAFSSQSI